MTQMLICKFKLPDGQETTIRTYRDNTRTDPEELYANLIESGAELISYEWKDTLTEGRIAWNEENKDHPEIQIPLDA